MVENHVLTPNLNISGEALFHLKMSKIQSRLQFPPEYDQINRSDTALQFQMKVNEPNINLLWFLFSLLLYANHQTIDNSMELIGMLRFTLDSLHRISTLFKSKKLV